MIQINENMVKDVLDAVAYTEEMIDAKISAAVENHWTRCSVNIEADSMRFRGVMPIIKARYEAAGYLVEVTPKVTYISWETAILKLEQPEDADTVDDDNNVNDK